MKKYIYISGYGRSGSTIVDLYIANSKGFVSVGEFICLADNFKKNKFCTCNLSFSDCDFWARYICNYNKLHSFSYQLDLLRKVLNDTSIVDSSKTVWNSFYRPILFRHKLSNCNFTMLHVYRHPKYVYQSVLSGSNKIKEKNPDSNFKKSFQLVRVILNLYISIIPLIYFKIFRLKSVICNFDRFIDDFYYRCLLLRDLNLTTFEKEDDNGFTISHDSRHMVDGNRLRFSNFLSFKKPLFKLNYNISYALFFIFAYPHYLFVRYLEDKM